MAEQQVCVTAGQLKAALADVDDDAMLIYDDDISGYLAAFEVAVKEETGPDGEALCVLFNVCGSDQTSPYMHDNGKTADRRRKPGAGRSLRALFFPPFHRGNSHWLRERTRHPVRGGLPDYRPARARLPGPAVARSAPRRPGTSQAGSAYPLSRRPCLKANSPGETTMNRPDHTGERR
jgi:hypothetical protein